MIWRILVRLLSRIRDTYLFRISVACLFCFICLFWVVHVEVCLFVGLYCLLCAVLWKSVSNGSDVIAASCSIFRVNPAVLLSTQYLYSSELLFGWGFLLFRNNLLNFKCFGVALHRHNQAWVSAARILTFLHVDCSKKLLLNFSLFPNYYFAFLPRVYINGAFQNLFEHKEKRNLVYHQISLKRVGKGKLCTRELRLEIYLCLKISKFCHLILISVVSAAQFDSRSIIFSDLRLDWRWCVLRFVGFWLKSAASGGRGCRVGRRDGSTALHTVAGEQNTVSTQNIFIFQN